MSILHVMVGIPGSGKSTYAKLLAIKLKCKLIATDDIRDLHPGWPEKDVWPEAYRLCAEEIKLGKDVIFDATNITPRVRKRLIEEIESFDATFSVGCYYIKTPRHECLRRVIKRNESSQGRYLPPEVVFTYAEKISPPTEEEGFIFIKIIDGEKIEV